MDFILLNEKNGPKTNASLNGDILSEHPFFERWKEYITTDAEVLRHRQALFSDLLRIDGLSDFLVGLCGKLTEYAPLVKKGNAATVEEGWQHLLYPTVYVEVVETIYEGLFPVMDRISCEALRGLYELAEGERESREYERVERYYEKNARGLRSVHSVTVGVNLDGMYQPKEAGILALNEEEFKSGDLLDRIIRLDFGKDGVHCIAPITAIDKTLGFRESQQVNYAFLKAMGKVLDHGLCHIGNRLLRYVKEKLFHFFAYSDILCFVADAVKELKVFQEKNIPLCFPKISSDRSFRFVSLYDPTLCVSKEKKDIVPNSICLENGINCYILTGPNSGGKTVFLRSFGKAQCYFQLGMPIPAKEAELPVCDAIWMVSAEKRERTDLLGRFERECSILSEILSRHTSNTLVLIDEALTSTSAAEAVPIAAGFIRSLGKKGGTCVFVTHYHELGACDEAVGHLHTSVREGKRSYAVQMGKGTGDSYAQSIAKKYHLIME